MTMMKIWKQKAQKKCFIKWKLKLEDNKNSIDTNQIQKEINHLEKN